MKKEISHLSLGERQILYTMRGNGESFRKIAQTLERSVSTVWREICRNKGPSQVWRYWLGSERAEFAHNKSALRKQERIREHQSLLDQDAVLRIRVLDLLESTNYSPEAIAQVISQSDYGVRISGKSIRRWIKRNYPKYQQHFPHRGKRRRARLTSPHHRKRQHSAPEKQNISERPPEANKRLRIGDLELDLIVCRQSTSSILSIRDRKTRHCWLVKIESRESEMVRRAIIGVINQLPPVIKTCTYDRGSEFAEVWQLKQLFQIENYFCDAYSAWQKGSVENQNKEVRRYIKKGTDLSKVEENELKRIELLLNHKPRKCLSGCSSSDSWHSEIAAHRRMLH